MVCPGCQSYVPDDAVICEACNAVVDTSILGDDFDEALHPSPEDRTPPRAPPPPPLAPVTPAAALASTPAIRAASSDPLTDFAAQYRGFSRGERLSVVGAGALIFALGLPWKWTKGEGDLIGYFAGAWHLGLFAGVVTLVLLFRSHPKLVPFRTPLLLVQLGAAAFALLGSVVFSRDASAVERVWASGKAYVDQVASPSFGVYFGLAAAAIMLVGAVVTWLDRDRLTD